MRARLGIGPMIVGGVIAMAPFAAVWAQGDGAGADNPALLRGSCTGPACWSGFSDLEPIDLYHPAPPARTIAAPPAPAPAPEPYQLAYPPTAYPEAQTEIYDAEPAGGEVAPPLRVVPSLALRGAYIVTGEESRFEAQAVPRITATLLGLRSALGLSASATIVRPDDGALRVGAATAGANFVYALDRRTNARAGLSLDFSQPDPRDDTDLPGDTMTAPLAFTGEVTAGLDHDFGRTAVALDLGLRRTQYDNTILADGTAIDNADRNLVALTTGLRLTREITPILDVFTEASLRRDLYDAPSASLGISQDGWRYGASIGVAGNWREVLTAEASVGYQVRRWDDAALGEIGEVVYGARLGYRPNETLTLSASYQSAIEPVTRAEAAAAASFDHSLTADASYRLNSWVGLRGSAGLGWRDFVGTDAEETRYSAGAGADIVLGPHTSLNADYGFVRTRDGNAAAPQRDEHRVTLGITLSR